MIELTRRLTLAALLAGMASPLLAESHVASGASMAAATTEISIGAADAPVTIVEYASFTCPHCAAFHTTSFPLLKADYIDTGKVRLIYREVYFDRYGLKAALLARCAGADKYLAVAKIIYETQAEWLADGEPATVDANLTKIGLTLGLPEAQITACLMDQATAETMVEEFRVNMENDPIEGTPAFLIDGVLQEGGNLPYDEFKALIETALAQ